MGPGSSVESLFRGILDRNTLRAMAQGGSYWRGEQYFVSGRVGTINEHDGELAAKVKGTHVYQVKLRVKGVRLDYSCTCPVGADGAFCKHCVALGLAWVEGGRPEKAPRRTSAKPAVTMNDVRAHLAGQDKQALVEMLMHEVRDDDRLRQRLLMKAAKSRTKGINLETYRRVIDDAVAMEGFVEYGNAYDYARGIEEAIDSIAELLGDGHAAEVIELSEYALKAVEQVMGSVDDSNGEMGGLSERLQKLHHKACRRARPDPEELARRLFEWELSSEWEVFYKAAQTYADVLGKRGLAVYRKLAEGVWAKVPAIGPGREDGDRFGKRFRITSIMEALAHVSGDVEALVAVKKRNLSYGYGYLEIARIYKQARKHDLALEWAERGIKAFPRDTDDRLREFLAEEYHRRGRHEEAMALVWAEFADRPGLEQYKNLKAHAGRVDQWQAWREKALGFLRETIETDNRKRRSALIRVYDDVDDSELVRIFLWEKDVESAWREAEQGGCSGDLWMKLAAKREKAHPEDALRVYQGQIDPTLARKNNEAYREAIGLLRRVRGTMARLGREPEFEGYLASVRLAHKPKRNFVKLLDHVKW